MPGLKDRIRLLVRPPRDEEPRLPEVASSVALIMDGNGRWARRRGLPVIAGHRAGARALRRTVEAAIDLGVGSLSVYAFSTENWTRPPDEVRGPARPARRDDPSRVPGSRGAGRARALRRPARPSVDGTGRRDAGTRGHDGGERGARPVRLLRLRRARRARRGRASSRARPRRRRRDRRGRAPRAAVRAAAAGSRPGHPLLRREPRLELPAVPDRLRRARLLGRAVARLRP